MQRSKTSSHPRSRRACSFLWKHSSTRSDGTTIKSTFLVWSHGKTVLGLDNQVLGYVRQNHLFIKLRQMSALDVEITPISILQYLPPNIRNEFVGFLEFRWKRWTRLRKLQLECPEEVHKLLCREKIVEGVREAIGQAPLTLTVLEDDVYIVETKAKKVLKLLSVRPLPHAK